jgi:hypothetical protein
LRTVRNPEVPKPEAPRPARTNLPEQGSLFELSTQFHHAADNLSDSLLADFWPAKLKTILPEQAEDFELGDADGTPNVPRVWIHHCPYFDQSGRKRHQNAVAYFPGVGYSPTRGVPAPE